MVSLLIPEELIPLCAQATPRAVPSIEFYDGFTKRDRFQAFASKRSNLAL